MRLDPLEGVRTLQWSVSTHRTHPASRTPSIASAHAAGRRAGRGPPVDSPVSGHRQPSPSPDGAVGRRGRHRRPGGGGRHRRGRTRSASFLPRPRPDGELAVVERHKHRIKARDDRPAAALAGRGDGALPDGLGLRAGMPSPRRVKALRSDSQAVPSSAAAALTLPSRSRVGRRVGLDPVVEEAAGRPAQWWRSYLRASSAPHGGMTRRPRHGWGNHADRADQYLCR
jgi:hypothetical protein